ncbi:lysophospholipid transporter LplT [Methylobacillus flagellatus]|uniref:lysophospholipid transporter LplT n=1 Tax=Methylobacillus flagellatus TaxID=405 RepID=UPI002853CAA1|nr:lysophospholipid transporter LplT [Methylobacillus flagellatus]MDR5172009.1 lysophospholipid transporter LplT [Methylobacillus flagellatus]
MTAHNPTVPQTSLLSRGMLAVMLAQFLSALADNALLFAAIALIKAGSAPAWQVPLLQESFVIAYIILAPFAGPFADTLPKGRVMLIANSMKFLGAAAMLAGLNPLLAYGMVGLGAAAYSPAKYGILSELVAVEKLVKANSLMEGSTIVAILLGAVVGGWLADYWLAGALYAIATAYLLAAAINLLIPRLPPSHVLTNFAPLAMCRDFLQATRTLMQDRDAKFSIVGTSIFWGAGSTLRFLLVAWVPVALNIHDLSTPANLSGAVAIGIALGAIAAARWVDLRTVNRALPAGVLIGLAIMAFAYSGNIATAIAWLLLIGFLGGFYAVPLNALLQERGHESVGSGHAIAIQNLFENISMLLMMGLYILLSKQQLPVIPITVTIGGLVFLAIGWLAWSRIRQEAR